MPAYYSNRRYSGYNYRPHRVSKANQLAMRYGAIVEEIKAEFFAQQGPEREKLLASYEHAYGRSARAYAERTILSWSSGSVQMSGQTAQRLLDLVPPQLSDARRFALVRTLRDHYRKKSHRTVRCTVIDWRAAVEREIAAQIRASNAAEIPTEVREGVAWLVGDDVDVAQELIARAEEEEARDRASYLEAEFARLAHIIPQLAVAGSQRVNHTIELPQGNITIQVKVTSSWGSLIAGASIPLPTPNSAPMNSDSNKRTDLQPSSSPRDLTTPIPVRQNIIDLASRDLTDAEIAGLRDRAIEVKMDLDKARLAAEGKFESSSHDLARTVQVAQELERSTQGDFRVNASIETASGTTQIQVSRANNMLIVIVAVVLGIILVAALS